MTIKVPMQESYPIELIDQAVFQDYTANNVYQPVDYAAAKATRASLRAMAIKFGEGWWTGYPLDEAQRQFDQAGEAGWIVFPYHFFHSEYGPAEQAQYFYDRTAGRRGMQYLLDVEDVDSESNRPPVGVVPPADYPMWIKKALNYCSTLRNYQDAFAQKFGKMGIWYGAAWCESWALEFAQMGGMDMSWVHLPKRWIASYTAPLMHVPSLIRLENIIVWQHTSEPADGSGPGHQVNGYADPGRLDLNYWLKSEAEFEQMFVTGGVVVPPVPNPEPGVQAQIQELNQRMQTVEDLVSDLMLTRQKVREA